LSYFPWESAYPRLSLSHLISSERLIIVILFRSDLLKCLVFAALACVVRPTGVIIWIFSFGALLLRLRFHPKRAWTVLLQAFAIGYVTAVTMPPVVHSDGQISYSTTALVSLFAIDSAYYGRPTLTPLNFLLTNFHVSAFYGTNQWHYYFTQALPILLSTALPFALHGAYLLSKPQFGGNDATLLMVKLVAWTLGVYSLGRHKEWRFVHPLLPLLHICAAKSLVSFNMSFPKTSFQRNGKNGGSSLFLNIRSMHLAVILLNLPLIYYVLRWHGSAQISVMHYLRSLPQVELDTLGFLMPCHSTPWQAYLHRSELNGTGKMWALGCEPPLGFDFALLNGPGVLSNKLMSLIVSS
jgi:phosphatidylinositol glycan class B